MIFRNKKANLAEGLAKYEKEPPGYKKRTRTVSETASRYVYDKEENCYRNTEVRSENTARLMCVGDLMCEEKMYKAYNFDDKFLPYGIFYCVKKVFAEADFVIGNLETTICEEAPYTGEEYKINGKYHCNAPASYLDILKYAGFDMFALSNNHNLDCGALGIGETIEEVEKRKFLHTGLYTDPNEKDRYVVVNINGIKVAFLSYSTWFNRNLNRLTEKGQGLLNIYDIEKVKENITAAKGPGEADLVIVYMHWGVDREYKHQFGDSQRRQAEELAAAGADYIVGSHTHSLQGYEEITAPDGRIVPVIYSLGNFATSERNYLSRDNAILTLNLKKGGDGKVSVSSSYIPCHVFDNFYGRKYPIVPAISKYNENCESEYLEKTKDLARELLGKHICEYGKTEIEGLEISDYIDKKLIIKAGGASEKDIEAVKDNEKYVGLCFAKDSVFGCAAFIMSITSDPNIKISRDMKVRLAEEAASKGAKAIVTDEHIEGYPCIFVDNVFSAWCEAHKILRTICSPKVIGITGSIGKTTTTEMIYHVVSSKHTTHRNTGSANSVRYTGVVLQKLKKKHKVYVQEIMEGPPFGTAATMSEYIRPDISVITKVASSHMEAFGSQERIAESCFGIEVGMPEDGVVIINADDEYQMKYDKKRHKCISYGIENENADFRARDIKQGFDKITFKISYEDKIINAEIHCVGAHNVSNALAAFISGKLAGMTDDEIVRALASYRTSGIRQNMVKIGTHNLFLDCYNASSESIKGALDSVDIIKKETGIKTAAVIGDVLELGEKTVQEHKRIGEHLKGSAVDTVVCYGPSMKYAFEALRDCGDKTVLYTKDYEELLLILDKMKKEDNFILFKGSHGMALEKAVDAVFGTWYHEEFERYDFIAKNKIEEGINYTYYSDHVTVTGGDKTERVIIPESISDKPVTGIEKSAFSQSGNIKELDLPNSLRNIRYCAFYKCSGLTEVTIPESVRIIDRSAFSTCANLRVVKIENGTVELGYRAFGNCANLEKIYIPESVVKIGGEAFLNCKNLKIYCVKDSFADKYAKRENIETCYIE